MQNNNSRRTRNALKKLLGFVAVGAFAIAPLTGVIAPQQAQAQNGNRETRTFEGVVTNDLQGRNFTLRMDNGQRILVQLDEREPIRLSAGDRVRVVGFFRRNQQVFRADEVRIIRNQGNNNSNRTFTGRVTDVESDQRFRLVVNGETYNVFTSSRLPRRLNEGDTVRVYGRRSGNNDIVNATVELVNNGNQNSDYRTFTGRVRNVESDQRFDLVVNGATYNVSSNTRLPRRLTDGDWVRVNGTRSGDNNIINASVAIVANDDGNNRDDDRDGGKFANLMGRVTSVRSDRSFDVVASNGVTYNITSDSRLPRELNAGDEVRVYGRFNGGNDIFKATVTVTRNR